MTGHMPVPSAAQGPWPSGGRPPASATWPVAQVSHQTVSRVINGSPNVSRRPKAVVEAIDQLGFRPNRAARALAGGPVQSVTVLMSNTRLYGPASALKGIEEATHAAGFSLEYGWWSQVRLRQCATPWSGGGAFGVAHHHCR